MVEGLGLTDKNDRDGAKTLILYQPPHRALIRSNHFEPYIQADVEPFWKRKYILPTFTFELVIEDDGATYV